jgi:hypothetical protein
VSDLLTIDKRYPECCTLNAAQHVVESLGKPLDLPEAIETLLGEHWANSEEVEPNLLQLFKLLTGSTYEQVARDNTYNHENDLDSFYVFTVYADIGCPDWCWRRDVFVVVEMGAGGDPRYSSYGSAQVFRLEDCCLGDTGFFDLVLGWWAEPIRSTYDSAAIDPMNDRIGIGYSSHPYYQLESLLYASPVWSDKRQAFIGRFKGTPYPVALMPHAPHYGG